ncbi:ABC transporter ATP-binding protein [Metamycoplasma buccale]|uniref:ABC transporter ATP-binding protein n=1 Tax=Metamycoplasma buccale TaxID=55602 RepID=UPI00398E5822
MKLLETKNLTFSYNKKCNILEDINLSCHENQIVTLLGLNGSGKTTLLKLLAGLINKYDGEILVDNLSIKKISIKNRATKISYVSQLQSYLEDFIVKDFVLFSKLNKLKFIQNPTKNDEEEIFNYAKKLQIDYLLNKKLAELSGGEKQIISIFCALIQDTKIILMDEPTSALDIKNQYKILSLIKGLARQNNKLFIISTHNPNHALYLNSYVYILKDHKIYREGNAKEIINKDILEKVYDNNICYSNELEYNEISFQDTKNN